MKKLWLMLFVAMSIGVILGVFRDKQENIPRIQIGQKMSKSVAGMLPSIQSFLTRHPEFGTPSSVQNILNSAVGKRQRVRFTNGRSLLFYLENSKVITIYENNPYRTKIWGSYSKPKIIENQKFATYEILFGIHTGMNFVEILVPSFSRQTSIAELRKFSERIGKQKGYSIVILYSTKEAYEANMSEQYSKAHPNALKIGYLGQWKNGCFTGSLY